MQPSELRSTVLAILTSIAPEVEPTQIDAAAPLRDQIDLDSMDYLNFIIALHDRLKVDIPESDYRRLGTLEEIVAYLQEKIPA